jgi:hypothetical protein
MKAIEKITDHATEMVAFYDFLAEHWIYLRTTNPRVEPDAQGGSVA